MSSTVSTKTTSEVQRPLTIAEVADHLQVTTKTVYAWIGGGSLTACRIGRILRVLPEDLNAFVRRNRRRN